MINAYLGVAVCTSWYIKQIKGTQYSNLCATRSQNLMVILSDFLYTEIYMPGIAIPSEETYILYALKCRSYLATTFISVPYCLTSLEKQGTLQY